MSRLVIVHAYQDEHSVLFKAIKVSRSSQTWFSWGHPLTESCSL